MATTIPSASVRSSRQVPHHLRAAGTNLACLPGDTMASMQGVQPRVGYTDLLSMPEDGRRYEIHGGELVVVPSPLPRHRIAALATFTLLREHTAAAGGIVLAAPLDIVFAEHDVVQPDVVFFRAERRHLVQPDAVTRHAPDIALSCSRRRSGRTTSCSRRTRGLCPRYSHCPRKTC